jgi:crotonobetainyl-CoA:carnitine CoA-transferase CaiB-like acyl-CoA transferase
VTDPAPKGDAPVAPLAGTRVLDLTGRIGAYCSKVLADLGADVLKVELPTGDRLRSLPPYRDGVPGPESSLLFAYYHHNKRGITLDWGRADALALLGELARSADVVLASPKGERTPVTGFTDEPPSLVWAPPGALTCFLTPFGLTGPYRDWRATPLTSFAVGGHMHHVGPAAGPPLAMPGQQLYDEAGAYAATRVLAALQCRPGARPAVIDHSAHEAALFKKLGQDPYGFTGRFVTRASNFGPPPSGVWACRDGRVDIAPHAPHHWDVFVDLLGRPDALADPLYRDRTMRAQLFDLLAEVITGALSEWDAAAFVDAAQAAGLPCALVQTGSEFVEQPQPRGRGFFTTSERPGTGAFDIPGRPFAAVPPLVHYRKAAPVLGEANEDVYVGELGHSPDELEDWRAGGLI